MPTITYYRIWCKSCKDFKLHNSHNDNYICKDCSNTYSSVLLSEIPNEKLEEQRKRYSKRKSEKLFSFLDDVYTSNPLESLFDERFDTEIIESDAGQKKIDDHKRKEIKGKKEKLIKEREESEKEYEKYKYLNRNDICICGSGKKYKKCCLNRIKNIWEKL